MTRRLSAPALTAGSATRARGFNPKGKKVKSTVRAIIIPATQNIYRQAIKEGLIEIFAKAGCVVSTPTCGPCLGGHCGILADGETAITTTNRNFIGRMGSPRKFGLSGFSGSSRGLRAQRQDCPSRRSNGIIVGSPRGEAEGRPRACPKQSKLMILRGKTHKFGDDVNTDDIIAAKYLVTTDPIELGKKCMETIAPDFVKR